jgi:hypothetical protein
MKLVFPGHSRICTWPQTPLVWAVLLACCATIGCSDKSGSKPKIKKVQGTATKIDLTNNRVAMAVVDAKGNPGALEGTVREDTEVWINGRSQRLEDVREGDKVEVYGFKEGSGEEAKLVATKVVVTRPVDSDWKSTSKPAAPSPPGSSNTPASTGSPQTSK